MGANEDIPRAVDPPELPDASELTQVSDLTIENGGFHAEVSFAEDMVLADTKAETQRKKGPLTVAGKRASHLIV